MEYDEIMEMVVAELTERGLYEQKKENPELAGQIGELADLSDEARRLIKKDEQAFDKLEQYMSLSNVLAGHQMKYLYLQGAKDCVRLLKALEVI